MSDKKQVPYGDDPAKTATLLLAAADDLDLDPGVVETTSDQVFKVPAEVAEKAGLETVEDAEAEEADTPEEPPVTKKPEPAQEPDKPPAKRTTRKAATEDKEQTNG
jgi:hypothetical protein